MLYEAGNAPHQSGKLQHKLECLVEEASQTCGREIQVGTRGELLGWDAHPPSTKIQGHVPFYHIHDVSWNKQENTAPVELPQTPLSSPGHHAGGAGCSAQPVPPHSAEERGKGPAGQRHVGAHPPPGAPQPQRHPGADGHRRLQQAEVWVLCLRLAHWGWGLEKLQQRDAPSLDPVWGLATG